MGVTQNPQATLPWMEEGTACKLESQTKKDLLEGNAVCPQRILVFSWMEAECGKVSRYLGVAEGI